MIDPWKSGEKSLKDASQKLHDERASSVKLDGLYERLMAFPVVLGQIGGTTRDDWEDLGIFPRAGVHDTSTQPPTIFFFFALASRRVFLAHCDSAVTEKQKSTSCVSGNA